MQRSGHLSGLDGPQPPCKELGEGRRQVKVGTGQVQEQREGRRGRSHRDPPRESSDPRKDSQPKTGWTTVEGARLEELGGSSVPSWRHGCPWDYSREAVSSPSSGLCNKTQLHTHVGTHILKPSHVPPYMHAHTYAGASLCMCTHTCIPIHAHIHSAHTAPRAAAFPAYSRCLVACSWGLVVCPVQ